MLGEEKTPKIMIDGNLWTIEGFTISELNHLYIRLYNPIEKKWSNIHLDKNYDVKNNIFTKLIKKKYT